MLGCHKLLMSSDILRKATVHFFSHLPCRMLAFPLVLFNQADVNKIRGNRAKCTVEKGEKFVKLLKNLSLWGIGPDGQFLMLVAEVLCYASEFFTSLPGGRLTLMQVCIRIWIQLHLIIYVQEYWPSNSQILDTLAVQQVSGKYIILLISPRHYAGEG